MDGFDYEAALSGCARGDREALRGLYDRAAPLLLGIALRIVRRPDLAGDVLHDAFLDVWRGAATFDPGRGAARAWVVGVVRHRALKAVRRAARETALDPAGPEAADEAPDAFAALARSQEGAALRRCLGLLEPRRREVVLLAYVEGLSQSQIARRLDAPLGTIKAWTRRSLISLRECLA